MDIGGVGGGRKGVGGLPCPVVAAPVVDAGVVEGGRRRGRSKAIAQFLVGCCSGVVEVSEIFGAKFVVVSAAAGRRVALPLRRGAKRSPARRLKKAAGTARHSPARQTCMWRRCAEGAGAAKSKLAPACGCARRGKEASPCAGDEKAQNYKEDGD